MELKYTPAQEAAVNAYDSNILVSAAAGSGKTRVLVDRVINLITRAEYNTDLDELLVVTFTNAAATEMKVRISERLNEIIREEPNNSNVRKQLSLLPSARISTIDSFCINLVRENFFTLGIEQDFRVMDSSEEVILQKSIIDELVEQRYESEDEDFRLLVELLSSMKSDKELTEAVLKINDFISSQPYPLEWLRDICELYNPETPFDKSVVKAVLVDEICFTLDYIREIIDFERSLLIRDDGMYEKYSDMLSEDEQVINSLYSSLDSTWEDIRKAVKNVSFSRAPQARGEAPAYKDLLLDRRKVYAAAGGLLNKKVKPLLSYGYDDIKADNEKLYKTFKVLCALVGEFNTRLLESKKELGSYSFSDIEHFAIQLLFYPEDGGYKRTELADTLSAQFKEILVDEYQDTNTAQDKLFEMLSSGKNRFMVGDITQSIYRFRLAMPSIFSSKKESYKPYKEGSGETEQKIILDTNFRSKQEICDFTNFLFSNLMTKKIGELDYTEEDYLNKLERTDDVSDKTVQLCIADVPEGYEKVEYEARCIADLIVNKVKNRDTVTVKGKEREVGFGDFAVLLRSAKGTLPVFSKVFAEYGIPAVANNRTNLFENNEISILISLLRVIDNPMQDIPLLSTLMSVFYGYSADDIALARVNCKKGNLYTAICNSPERYKAFLSDLEKYRRYASSMSVESFIRQIISDTSYPALISVMGNSEQRKLNVQLLVGFARNFDSGENAGLSAFIRYIDSIIEAGLDVDSAELPPEELSAVRIMSIHGSKGLEFPIVIFADTSHQYNTIDERASLLLNNDLGAGLKVHDEERLCSYDSVQYTAIKNMNSNASMSENLRVLYVALTRAESELICFISNKNILSKIAALGNKVTSLKLNPYAVRQASSDAELLIMASLTHKDAGKLRELCSHEIPVNDKFDFPLCVNIINDVSEMSESEGVISASDTALIERIRDKLSFKYERALLSSYASKRAASSLDEREHGFKYFASEKPSFMYGDKITSAEKGTAMHAFMQYCDYQNSRDNLEDEIDRLTELSLITGTQSDCLDRDKLKTFFSSALAARMFRSDRLYRELRLSSFVSLSELEDTDIDDEVLVQGIADCVFEEDGKLVLVDYKTDRVKSEEELLDLYRKQLSFYKRAVSKTLGMEVKETMLYSFELGRECIYT